MSECSRKVLDAIIFSGMLLISFLKRNVLVER